MKRSKDLVGRSERFFAGKGFYIVLFLCAAVIAVSTWILLTPDESANGDDTVNAGVVLTPGDDSAYMPSDSTDANVDASDNSEPAGAFETDSPSPSIAPSPETTETVADEPDNEEPLVFSWPVSGSITVAFSPDDLVFNKTMQDWRTHNGVDIAADLGTRVLAIAAGTVSEVYADDMYGTTVVIDHGDGLKSIYQNLASIPTVEAGDQVQRGDVIGSIGDTALAETSQETHLHLVMTLYDELVDPMDYLPN